MPVRNCKTGELTLHYGNTVLRYQSDGQAGELLYCWLGSVQSWIFPNIIFQTDHLFCLSDRLSLSFFPLASNSPAKCRNFNCFLPAAAVCSVGSGGQLSQQPGLGVVCIAGAGGGPAPHLKHCQVTSHLPHRPVGNVKQTRREGQGGRQDIFIVGCRM